MAIDHNHYRLPSWEMALLGNLPTFFYFGKLCFLSKKSLTNFTSNQKLEKICWKVCANRTSLLLSPSFVPTWLYSTGFGETRRLLTCSSTTNDKLIKLLKKSAKDVKTLQEMIDKIKWDIWVFFPSIFQLIDLLVQVEAQTVYLMLNSLKDSGTSLTLDSLRNQTSLETLSIGKNQPTENSAKKIVAFLERNTNLREINLQDNQFG